MTDATSSLAVVLLLYRRFIWPSRVTVTYGLPDPISDYSSSPVSRFLSYCNKMRHPDATERFR